MQPCPEGKTLLPFQAAGVGYMAHRLSNGHNVLLADEQGLGKTIELIGVCNALGAKSVLVICPASLKLNWRKEILAWSTLGHVVEICNGWGYEFQPQVGPTFTVINYELVYRAQMFWKLQARTFDVIAIDESHRVRNMQAKQTRAILGCASKGRYRYGHIQRARIGVIAMTGTPMPSRPVELYPMLRYVFPETIGKMDFRSFADYFCGAYETDWGLDTRGARNLDELRQRLDRVMLRRLKVDCLPDLPPKFWNLVTLEKDKATKAVTAREKAFDPEEILAKADHPMLAFEGLSELRREMGLAKVPVAVRHIEDILENVDKLVVFAWHRDVLEELEMHLRRFQPVVLHGAMTNRAKQLAVDTFQSSKACRVFIGNIQAAGVGHTLTAASNVVFVEPSWVPSDMDQAADRCHRIGQRDNVNVQVLVVDGSLDSYIMQSVFEKLQNIGKVVKPTAPEKLEKFSRA